MNASLEKPKDEGNNPTRSEYRIMDISSMGILITRIGDDQILYANQTVANLVGIPDVNQLLGQRGFNFYWDANEYRLLQERFRAEGILRNHELRAQRADGSSFWILLSVRPFDFHGEAAVISEVIDITERKQAEEALRQTQALYQSLIEVSPMSICRKDLDGRFTFANRRFLELSQIELGDLVGKTDFDLHPSALAEKYRRDDLAVMESGQVQEIIEERMVHEGEVAYVETIKAPIYDEAGKVNGIQISFWDITDRKRVEDDLLIRDRALASSMNAVIITRIKDGTPIYLNDALLEMTGYSRDEAMQLKFADLVGDPGEMEQIQAALDAHGFFSGEKLIKRKDGSWVPTNYSTSLIKDAKGRSIAVQSSLFDITERKQAEAAISLAREQLEHIINFLPDATLVIDNERKVIAWNRALEEMTGIPAADMLGKGDYAYTVPFYGDRRPMMIDFALSPESVIPERYFAIGETGQRLSGEIFVQAVYGGKGAYLYATAAALYDKDGHIMGAVESIRDVTERKQAESAVLQEKNLSDATINSLPGIFYMFDTQGHLLRWNKNYETVLGYSTEEVAKLTALDGISEEDRERAAQAIQTGFVEGAMSIEVHLKSRQGTKIPYLFNARTMTIGEAVYAVGTGSDISELKQLELQVQEAFQRRGYQVQVSTEIAQEVAAAPELNELFERVVTLIKERLGYYHTQLLRYDAGRDAVVLIKGYGATGQKMLAGGHQMPMGQGLIGTAAASGETVLRSTLADDPDWHSNPLLPETQGEIAVPIIWQNTVLGVLDVQSNQAGSLTEDDRLLLEGICGQVAIAMHSAELVEAVRQNEASLAEALRAARLANWEYDVERDLFTFNDEFYSIFHTSAEKVGGYQIPSARYAEIFVHPEDVEVVGIEIGKALSSTERVYNATLDHRIRYEDGGIGYITVKVTVERDENGKITRYYGANQDITERKQAEVALRESELRYQQILDAITDMILVKGEKSSIIWANKAFREYYGMTNEQLRDLIDAPMVEPDYTLQYIKDDAYVFETGQILQIPEEPVTRFDGTIRPFETFKAPIRDLNGKVVMTVGVSRDITERLREKRAMAERLEEINRLYQAMSQEGWKTYRETDELPAGFIYDQLDVRPVEAEGLPEGSFVNIPMKILGGEVVGTLTVADDPEHPTSPEDYAFLQQVSDQIALALEDARLTAQTQSALAQSESLYQLSSRLNTAATYDDILQVLRENTILGKNSQNISLNVFDRVWTPQEEPTWIDVLARWSLLPSGAVLNRYTLESLPSARTLLHPDAPTLIEDLETDEQIDEAARALYTQRFGAKSTIFFPVVVTGQWIGYINAIYQQKTTFPENEIRRLTSLAAQASTMINNLRQVERIQHQADRESTLNAINQKIQSATTVEAVLQIAARELGHALGAPLTVAQLSMKDRK